MLYAPGTHLGGKATTPASTQVCADMESIIDNWDEETFTVLRNTPTYDSEGMKTDVYAAIGTFDGDWQPAKGRTAREEKGRVVKSDAFIISPCDIDVLEDDRIRKADMTFMYVNYVKRYKGHITVFLKRTEGSN